MRIAIVAPSPVPFVVGGAEKLWWGMQRYLNEETTHSCELFKVPTKENSVTDLINSYYRFFRLDLSSFDRVISTKYPAFMLQHPDHHLYLQHLLRGCYDTYPPTLPARAPWADPQLRGLLATITRTDISLEQIFAALFEFQQKYPEHAGFNQFPGPFIRNLLKILDRRAMEGVQSFSAISETVKRRCEYFPPAAAVEVVHHPSNLSNFTCAQSSYIFTASRLDKPKRIDLLIRAYIESESSIPFMIAGTGPQEAELKQLAAGHENIRFLGFVSDREIEKLYADAAAVLYAPYDEDYGLITIEAFECGKPVITCKDSGGVNELVKDGYNGLVAAPDAQSLADAISKIPTLLTPEVRSNCQKSVAHIKWCNVMSRLTRFNDTCASSSSVPAASSKPRMLVLSTYPVAPAVAGGQLRLYHLLRRLSCRYHIVLLSLGSHDHTERIAPDLTEHVISETPAFASAKKDIEKSLGISAADIAFMLHWDKIPAFQQYLSSYQDNLACVLCAQPYVYPLVAENYSGYIIHDSQNMEFNLKSDMAQTRDSEYLHELYRVEKELCATADLTFCCAREDIDAFAESYAIPNFNPILVPNGVDDQAIPFLLPDERARYKKHLHIEGKIAIFIGSAHQPNVEAAKNIITLAAQLPEINFVLIGTVCDPLKKFYQSADLPSNVGFAGLVSQEEKNIYLQVADLALNPMQQGAGSNLKLSEYIAAGVPVISTPLGARGYNLLPGGIKAVSLQEFPKQIRQLIHNENPDQVSRVRKDLLQHYSWDSIVAHIPFEAVLKPRSER